MDSWTIPPSSHLRFVRGMKRRGCLPSLPAGACGFFPRQQPTAVPRPPLPLMVIVLVVAPHLLDRVGINRYRA